MLLAKFLEQLHKTADVVKAGCKTHSGRAALMRKIEQQGTATGRWSSTKPNLSNIPRPAVTVEEPISKDDLYPQKTDRVGNYMRHTKGSYTWFECISGRERLSGAILDFIQKADMESIENLRNAFFEMYPAMKNLVEKERNAMNEEPIADTIVETDEIVEVDCGKDSRSGKECGHCAPDRKRKIHGKRAKVIRKGRDATKVKMVEGDLDGKEAHCPPERVKPYMPDKFAEPEKEPEPEKPKPKMVVKDFGYGPACSSCHATRGEDHCKGCEYEGQTI